MSSAPSADYGAPSLGPIDRITPHPKDTYMSDPTPQPTQDRKYAGNYNPQPTPTPQQPNQQK